MSVNLKNLKTGDLLYPIDDEIDCPIIILNNNIKYNGNNDLSDVLLLNRRVFIMTNNTFSTWKSCFGSRYEIEEYFKV